MMLLCASILALCLLSCQLLNAVESNENLIHRLAVGSCSNPNKGGKIWRMIDNYSPDHLVLLGDVVYADYEAMGKVTSELPSKIVREYDILNRDKHWRKLMSHLPHWSITYDDHDYGSNNGDKTFLYRNFSMEEFRKFSKDAFTGFDTATKNGVYSSKVISVPGASGAPFTYKLIMLDSRSNKDPKGTLGGDFLGEEQWQWLTVELGDTSPDLIIVGSSVQVLSDDKFVEENWSEFPQAKDRLLKLLGAASLQTNVVLLSGDVHRAEISHASCTFSSTKDTTTATATALANVQTDVWELTSSGLAHTLRYYTDDSVLTSREDYVDSDPPPYTVPVKARNFFVFGADLVYQFAYPGYYREEKHAHAFSSIHFGLLDVLSAPQAASGRELVFTVISHANEVVMRKVLPLRTKEEILATRAVRRGTTAEELRHTAQLLRDDAARGTGVGEQAAVQVQVHCLPHWGAVPLWRTLVYRGIIVVCMLAFIVVPCLSLLWFVGASIYYIVRGSELSRRAEVERRYQENKKAL